MCHIERVDGNLVVIGSSGLIMQGCTIGPVRGDGGHKVHFAQSNTEKIVYATESTPNPDASTIDREIVSPALAPTCKV